MKQVDVRFRAEASKIASLGHDRNQDISENVDLYQWQTNHINEGIRQADAEEFASEQEVEKVLRRGIA